MPQFERFNDSAKWGQLQFRIGDVHSNRMQLRNQLKDRMLQFQNDRFHLNWLGESGETYPRFEAISNDFFEYLSRFGEYLKSASLGEIKPNQWEVTYLNQIPKNTVWSEPKDWSFFRPFGNVSVLDGIVDAESFGGEWHYTLPKQSGRLHVSWQHGEKAVGPAVLPVVTVTLTARGPVAAASDLKSRINIGRSVIVRSFERLMSDSANNFWGLKNDTNS
jgi:hypothetical protein